MPNSISSHERTDNDQKVVDHFNQSDAGWVQASEMVKAQKELSDAKLEMIEVSFERLSRDNVDEAKKMMDEVFALEKGLAGRDLESQIYPDRHTDIAHGTEINKNYWIVKNEVGEMIGITGFSGFEDDKAEHCWIGWFGLKPGIRGGDLGAQLLDKIMQEAITQGKTEMYTITSDHQDMAGNAKFYHQNGFPIVTVLDQRGAHRGMGSEKLSQPMVRKMQEDYAGFVETGVNIFIRHRELKQQNAI